MKNICIKYIMEFANNGSNSFLFVNTTKMYHFKVKDSEIKDYTMPLGNISKDFTINNMKKKQH